MLYGQFVSGSVYESLIDGNTLEPFAYGSDSAWDIVSNG